jgi:hypothetical protein
MSVHEFPHRPDLTPSSARQLTDSLKQDAESLWQRLLSAYERGAHTALGYSSWSAYCKTEFGTSKAMAYRLIDAGKVAKAIKAESPIGDSPTSESVVRELAPLLKQGDEAVAEAWHETVEKHGPNPTAAETREVVEAVNPKPKKLTREQAEFQRAVNGLELGAEYISAALAGRTQEEQARVHALLAVEDEVRNEWARQCLTIYAGAAQLRRALRRQGGNRP